MPDFDIGDFFDWWGTLPWWIRYPIAIGIIAGSTLGMVSTMRFGGKMWGLGWAVGFTLLFIGGSKPWRERVTQRFEPS